MKKIILTSLVVFLSGCATNITGRIVDEQGLVVTSPEGRINVSSIDEAWSKVLTVDKKGSFLVPDIDPKRDYLVEALIPGYRVMSVKVTPKVKTDVVITVSAIETSRVDAIDSNQDTSFGRGSGGASITPPSL